MAASSRTQSPIKRLLNELQTYQSDPNDALDYLGPVNDDELMHWTAVMRGVPGTAYEGILPYCLNFF
jgi:peroxin-4